MIVIPPPLPAPIQTGSPLVAAATLLGYALGLLGALGWWIYRRWTGRGFFD